MPLSYDERIRKIEEKEKQLQEQKSKLIKTMKKEAAIEKQKRHLKTGSLIESIFDAEIGKAELNVLKAFLEGHSEEIKNLFQSD